MLVAAGRREDPHTEKQSLVPHIYIVGGGKRETATCAWMIPGRKDRCKKPKIKSDRRVRLRRPRRPFECWRESFRAGGGRQFRGWLLSAHFGGRGGFRGCEYWNRLR